MYDKLKYIFKSIKNKGALHILLGAFSTKFVSLFGSIFIVRLLTKSDYGLLGYIENLYSFIYIIGGLGLSNATIRYVVLADNLEKKKGYYIYIRNRSLIYNFIFVFIFIVIDYLYPHPTEFEDSKLLIVIILFMLPFQYDMQNNLMLERAMFNNKRYAWLSFFTAAIFIAAKIVGAYVGDIIAVLILSTSVNIFCDIYTQRSVNKRYFNNIQTNKIAKKQRREIDIYSIQFMVTNGLWSLFMVMDVFLLGKLGASSIELADYKVAYIWPANLGIVGSCMAVFITPYFVKNENNLEWIRNNFKKIYLINLVVSIAIGISIWVLAKPLIYIYSGAKYLNTIPLMRVILIGAVLNNGCRMITANALSAMGQVKYNMIVSAIGFVLQILLNLYLIPLCGSYGVAYTSIIVYSLMSIALIVVFIKKYYLNKQLVQEID